MELKHNILKILEENRGNSVSGSKLADSLCVTRSAVWKAIKSLQEEGYSIEAVTNRGYCLKPCNDIVSAESITPFLKGDAINFTLDVRQRVTSTNSIAKELAAAGAKDGTVVIAREQTNGRGRMGRSFYSPGSTGIYFSLILRPKLSLKDSLRITTTTAVAVAQAMESVANVDARIKWVNDIFVKGKKVCGILTEASINFETGGLEYAVVGIGINVATETFPHGIQSVAGSVFSEKPTDIPITSMLTAQVLNNLSVCKHDLMDKKYLEEYRRRSLVLGKKIWVLKGMEAIEATAIAIDDEAQLVVEYQNHATEVLSCGEVSIRPDLTGEIKKENA
jgi:BirA family biotin operon repressor/biotin-[acetyl-CoA-carboxylase] ligase